MFIITSHQGNANKNHSEITLHTLQNDKKTLLKMSIIKKITNNKWQRGYEESRTVCIVGGNVNWCRHYRKEYFYYWHFYYWHFSLPKLKMQLPYDPEIPLLGIYPKKINTLIRKKHVHTLFHCNLLFPTIAKTWK